MIYKDSMSELQHELADLTRAACMLRTEITAYREALSSKTMISLAIRNLRYKIDIVQEKLSNLTYGTIQYVASSSIRHTNWELLAIQSDVLYYIQTNNPHTQEECVDYICRKHNKHWYNTKELVKIAKEVYIQATRG